MFEVEGVPHRCIPLNMSPYEEWLFSGMLCRVDLVKTDVSEEPSSSIRVTRIGEHGISSQRASVASCS
jgi:hypothetical protein